MKGNKLSFTEGFIDRLETTPTRQRFYDLKVKGLVLEVMSSGSKIFRFRKTVDYKEQWATIGPFPTVSLEDARDKAILLSAELVGGGNFTAKRQVVKDELTLAALADFYFDQYAKDRCTTATDMQKNFRRWFADDLSKRLSQIDTTWVQSQINKLAVGGHYHRANRALDDIKAIFSWGIKKGIYNGSNPAIKVDKFEVRSRERFIQPHEFNRLLQSIKSYTDGRLRDFFLICLYTGARSGNVMAMRWDQVDLDLGTWHIPRTKNGESQTAKLSDEALKILQERYPDRGLNPWVFPGGGIRQPTQGHIVEPKKAWKKVIENAGISDLRIHDLRRTIGSYMAMAGVNTPLIQKALGHKSLAAASIYQRVNNDPVKQGMDLAIRAMQTYASATKVVELPKTKQDS